MFKVALVNIDLPDEAVPDWVRSRLEKQGVSLSYRQCDTSADVIEIGSDADVVWVWGGSQVITAATLPQLKRCRAIVRTGSGTDNIPVQDATSRGILVVNTPQATTDPVSDHVVALILAVHRWIARQDRALRLGRWKCSTRPWPGTLSGSLVGLVGLGRIAQAVVKKLGGFDVQFVAFDPYLSADDMSRMRVRKCELDELLSQADIVSLHTPLTRDTECLIGRREFGRMKPTTIFINCSRGRIVDEEAMVEALEAGRIAGAGLDVFQTEPLVADSPLMKLDNVVLTPHAAADSDQFIDDFWRHSVDAICDLAGGRLPASYVNPEIADTAGFLPAD